jgi:hypothetical protein
MKRHNFLAIRGRYIMPSMIEESFRTRGCLACHLVEVLVCFPNLMLQPGPFSPPSLLTPKLTTFSRDLMNSCTLAQWFSFQWKWYLLARNPNVPLIPLMLSPSMAVVISPNHTPPSGYDCASPHPCQHDSPVAHHTESPLYLCIRDSRFCPYSHPVTHPATSRHHTFSPIALVPDHVSLPSTFYVCRSPCRREILPVRLPRCLSQGKSDLQ